MIRRHPANQRGHFDFGWLDTHHTFSFGDFHDPARMGFRALRVINEDRVQPGQGFGMHGHRDMEIISLILAGGLEHRDSLGNGSVITSGMLQRMTAGTGVRHSEFNPSATAPTHLYQIWLLPRTRSLPPGYEQREFDPTGSDGRLQLVAAPVPTAGALTVHQDAALFLARLSAGQEVRHELRPGRHAWLQVLAGAAALNGQPLEAGDGAAVSEEALLKIQAADAAQLLLFDLA